MKNQLSVSKNYVCGVSCCSESPSSEKELENQSLLWGQSHKTSTGFYFSWIVIQMSNTLFYGACVILFWHF